MVVVLIAIMSALALPKVSFLRYRQDANGRLVQKSVIVAQQRAVQFNTNVLFVIDYAGSRMRVVDDTNSNGAADVAERVQYWTLADRARFVVPVATVDGATASYATGPGITTTTAGPTITFYPNGSASGDAFVYIGVATGRSDALRAVEITGSTAHSRLWRYLGGAWRRDSL